jgi:hypothetical protein
MPLLSPSPYSHALPSHSLPPFPKQCKRRTNGTKRKGAADIIRLFLLDARDETTKNAFSRFKKRISVAQVRQAAATSDPYRKHMKHEST